VIMNFILAWFLLSVVLSIGAPQAIDDEDFAPDAKIQISQVAPETPAEEMGLLAGDEIVSVCDSEEQECSNVETVSQVVDFASDNKGNPVILKIQRGGELIRINGVPRADFPEGQGPLGVSLARTSLVSYSWHESIWMGAQTTLNLIGMIFAALFDLLVRLLTGKDAAMDVAGPVGIVVLTKQAATLGIVYLLQFTAILSINLGIINILPIPALDGGRILFILIEKIKGTPVSKRVEQSSHAIGFMLLILLMLIVTLRDVAKLDFFEKIKGFF